ncbi:hypothetical protein A483_HHAL011747, partial [Halyomorpha halys]
YCSQALIEDFP